MSWFSGCILEIFEKWLSKDEVGLCLSNGYNEWDLWIEIGTVEDEFYNFLRWDQWNLGCGVSREFHLSLQWICKMRLES